MPRLGEPRRGGCQRLASFVTDATVIIADPGDALFGAIDLPLRGRTEFLSPAYYASLGFAVPAAFGAQLAKPHHRPLVLVGDEAFQMTGLDLSTVVRYGLNPIIVVLNNGGYGTQRPMIDGAFNDVLPWRYRRIPELLGAGQGFVVEAVQQLDEALRAAARHLESFSLLEVRLAPDDSFPALQRLTATLGRAAQGRT